MPAAYLRIFRLLWTIKHVETVLEQVGGRTCRLVHARQRRVCHAMPCQGMAWLLLPSAGRLASL